MKLLINGKHNTKTKKIGKISLKYKHKHTLMITNVYHYQYS